VPPFADLCMLHAVLLRRFSVRWCPKISWSHLTFPARVLPSLQVGLERFDRTKFPELYPATLTEFAAPLECAAPPLRAARARCCEVGVVGRVGAEPALSLAFVRRSDDEWAAIFRPLLAKTSLEARPVQVPAPRARALRARTGGFAAGPHATRRAAGGRAAGIRCEPRRLDSVGVPRGRSSPDTARSPRTALQLPILPPTTHATLQHGVAFLLH